MKRPLHTALIGWTVLFGLWIANVSGCAGKSYTVITPAPGCDYWYDKDHVRGTYYLVGPEHKDLPVKHCYGGADR